MITTPEPFVFYIMHHVMIMVSIIKGADSRTLQNISTYKEIDYGYVLQIASHIILLLGSSRNCYGGFGGWRETSTKTTLFYVLRVMIIIMNVWSVSNCAP